MWTHVSRAGHTLVQGLVHLVYPCSCWACGQALPESCHSFCDACRSELTKDRAPTCPRCASSIGPYIPLAEGCPQCRKESFAFDQAFRLGLYDGLLRDVVLRLKHWSGEGLGEAVGRLWAEHSGGPWRQAGVDVVIPVPLHWWKRWRRGYNQSLVLARCLADFLKVPCRPRWLRRVRFTAQQKELSLTARRDNLRDAFRARSGIPLAGKTVLLVDDVMTSGATASEAARGLRPARPAKIILAVLAHDRKPTAKPMDLLAGL